MKLLKLAAFIALAAACGRGARDYPLRGQVLALNPERGEIAVKHDDIPGLMPGMTMTFKVADRAVLAERVPGDLIEATLSVSESSAILRNVRKIGFADLTPPAAAAAAMSVLELLKPGDAVPDQQFVDEAGERRRLADWRGKTLALTFIYTRCPIPTFCPMMDRTFAAVQKTAAADATLRGRVKLLSVTFDPAHDTPAVLHEHASKVGAKSEAWSFLTGDRDDIDRFAARFGVSIVRDAKSPIEIAHNLRTAVIGPDGRLKQVFTGNDWTPAQLVGALKSVAATD